MSFSSSRELVEAYVAASQRARSTQSVTDLQALRSFLAEDVTIRMASAWTDEPWRTVITSAEDLISRLQAPINHDVSLTTENLNVVEAGDDVIVEQLSTIRRDGQAHVSVVCHIFTVVGDRITGIRAYRNDLNLPPG
jgi:ketosteroid isomerase-like protein